MHEPVYLSKKGFKELRKEITQLEKNISHERDLLRDLDKVDTREERLQRIEFLSKIENLEVQLMEKKHQLNTAKPLPRKRDTLKVALGSVVDLLDSSGRLVSYTIVDSIEANPSDGRISAESPLGRSLLGRKLNESINWTARHRQSNLRLVGIN